MPNKKSKVAKTRIGGYIRADLVLSLRDLLETLPRSVTLSALLESAIEKEIRRIKRRGGWDRKPKKPKPAEP